MYSLIGDRLDLEPAKSSLTPFRMSDAGGLDLLPGVIAGANERAGFDVLEAHRHADVAHVAELIGRDVAVDRNVRLRRPQILAERQDVDVHRPEVAHDDLDLLEGLAHSEDDAALGRNVRRDALGGPEDIEHSFTASARPAPLVQARHRFGVVIVDVGPGLEHGANRVFVALKVGNEHLDRAVGQALLDLPDGLGKDVRAKVGQIVAVDRGDDDVPEPHFHDRGRDAGRLLDVVPGRPAVGNGTVRTVPRTDVAQNHEGGGAMLPALAHVWAVSFLT